MEETLREILRALKDYGTILRHIDGRIDALDGTIELVRQNQISIGQRETALEMSCQLRHDKIDEMLAQMRRRIAVIESRLAPVNGLCSEEG